MTIEITKVASVYSGQDGKCFCGCSGNHRYASAHRDWASKNRGYQVQDDEVSDRSIKIIVGKIEKAEKIEDEGDYVTASVNGRIYIAYRVH